MVRWQGRQGSRNVEDRRSAAGAAGASGLALLAIRFVLSRFGIGGVVVLVGGFFALRSMGIDPLALVSGGAPAGQPLTAADEEAGAFVSVILKETETVWSGLFREAGADYPEPALVLFSGRVDSACGSASSASGPFYCPADRKVFLDTGFFSELAQRFGAPGDFAAAYVIAHEVGHHVQTVTGISEKVRGQQSRSGETEGNRLQVKMELQADCYAGVWAHHADRTADILDEDDISEGLRAASAIGDDTLQRNAGRRVTPESFTHGSAEQRQRWFSIGFKSGKVAACDTFSAAQL